MKQEQKKVRWTDADRPGVLHGDLRHRRILRLPDPLRTLDDSHCRRAYRYSGGYRQPGRTQSREGRGYLELAGKAQAQHIQKLEPQATLTVIFVGFYERILSELYTKLTEGLRGPGQGPPGYKLHFNHISWLEAQQLNTDTSTKSRGANAMTCVTHRPG